jgi:hypothetical protein
MEMLKSVQSTQLSLYNQLTVANSVGNANRWCDMIPYCTEHNQHVAALAHTKHSYQARLQHSAMLLLSRTSAQPATHTQPVADVARTKRIVRCTQPALLLHQPQPMRQPSTGISCCLNGVWQPSPACRAHPAGCINRRMLQQQ